MGELSLPEEGWLQDETKLVKLAREIARGIKDVPDILHDLSVTQEEWETIQRLPYFGRMFTAELAAWGAADNVEQRIKVKSGTLIEENLSEIHARLNDASEPLMAKVKLLEVTARWAGLGERDIPVMGTPGDRVQVIINLGADQQFDFRKQLPPKVIDNEPSPLQQNIVDVSPNPV